MAYDQLATAGSVEKTAAALRERKFEPQIVGTGAEALAKIKELIPQGASIMMGSSQTLEQIGFIEYLKDGQHGWNNLKLPILAEKDPEKQRQLRIAALSADWYLGSVHAVTEDGEMLIASASGSQLPHLVYTSQNLILVVSTQKLMPDFNTAMARVREHVFPLEDARMKSTGASGSSLAKILLFEREPAWSTRKVHILLINEKLGF